VKLLEGKNISQDEVNLINSALASWHQSRQANNKTASLIFNILSGVISLGFFHLGYLIAKLFNKSLPTNPSKEIFKVFRSYKAMLKVESFLKETKGFKVGMPGQSFNLVTQSLEPSNAKFFADFRVNTQGLDDIFKQVQEEDSQSTVEEGVDVQSGSEEANYDMPLNDQNFGFNNFL
ncbi:MAG: hypothetical protein SFU25_06295, partial [Candidatus Caenarcaniphilales bacterium]|nr:hypothetical protein [Candidatus Caenarcaniphilales bacterium]